MRTLEKFHKDLTTIIGVHRQNFEKDTALYKGVGRRLPFIKPIRKLEINRTFNLLHQLVEYNPNAIVLRILTKQKTARSLNYNDSINRTNYKIALKHT
jgi:hypothetical protein